MATKHYMLYIFKQAFIGKISFRVADYKYYGKCYF